MFRRFIRFIRSQKKQLYWKVQTRKVKELCESSMAEPFRTSEQILVIAPHADDELIGCHQLISDNAGRVTIFYCGYLGSNPSIENRNIRELEISAYSKYQNCELIISSSHNVGKDLQKILNEIRPGFIFLPSYVDWHDEHRKINDVLFNNIVGLAPRIGWYHVSMPIPSPYINSYSVLNKEQLEHKWELMKEIYVSQLHMDLDRFIFIETIDDVPKETYIIQDVGSWKSAVRNFQRIDSVMLDNLKNSMGNIKKMYLITNTIYSYIYAL